MYATQGSVNLAAQLFVDTLRNDMNAYVKATLDGQPTKAHEKFLKKMVREELRLSVILRVSHKDPYTVEVLSAVPIIK